MSALAATIRGIAPGPRVATLFEGCDMQRFTFAWFAALTGCQPWFGHSITLTDHLFWVEDPADGACHDFAEVDALANDAAVTRVSEPHVTCMAGACWCVGPTWSLAEGDIPAREDAHIDITVGDGRQTARLSTEDPRIPMAVLVGPPTLRRGEERRIAFFSETPPTPDDHWGFTVGNDPYGIDNDELYRRCPESFYGCDDEFVDRAQVRFEGDSLFFTLPDDTSTGPAALYPSRTFRPRYLRCDFGSCDVMLSDTEPIAVTVE